MEIEQVINFDDARAKRSLMVRLGAVTGTHELTLKPYKPLRSNRANSYWWGVIVRMFQEYNREQGVIFTKEQAHDILKRELLPTVNYVSHRTGEVVSIASDTHTMNTEEFGYLIESAIVYLAEMGCVVPDPPMYSNHGG